MEKQLSKKMLKMDGGQFEIYLKKTLFPIKAPQCNKELILRMPWTKSSLPGAEKYIAEKIDLYQKLLAVIEGKKDSEKIIVELNPYIDVKNKEPLDIELTQCNVFFRHSHGRYIVNKGEIQNN